MLRRAAAILGVGLLLAGGGFGQGPVRVGSPAPSTAVPPTAAAHATNPAPATTPAQDVRVVISVPEQKLAVLVNGRISRSYKISTSRYGEGDALGSWRTPLGHLEVAHKIGGRAPVGAVFKSRQVTGEVLSPNAPGRDPVVSRIIWLRGIEAGNRHAYQRCIYIHGTPQESFLGRKASFGCIRMRSADIVEVFNWINIGTDVSIVPKSMSLAVRNVRGEVKTALARTAVAKVSSLRSAAKPAVATVGAAPSGTRTAPVRTASVH